MESASGPRVRDAAAGPLERLFEAVPLAPYQVGIATALALLALFVALAALTGGLTAFEAAGGDLLDQRDARMGVVVSLLAGYLPVARRYLALGTRANLAALDPLLGRDPALAHAVRPLRGAPIAGALGLLVVPIVALSVDRDPSLYLHASYWGMPQLWQWCVGGWVTWHAARFLHACVAWARRFSALAQRIPEPDPFDRRALAPFARQGLRSALLVLVLLATLSVNAVDRGFLWALGVIGGGGLLLAGVAVLLPVRGLRPALRRAKQEELRRVDAAIAGDAAALAGSHIAARGAGPGLGDLLAYRQYVGSLGESPFDAPMLTRFGLFLAIPLASWLGGALVERGLELLLD